MYQYQAIFGNQKDTVTISIVAENPFFAFSKAKRLGRKHFINGYVQKLNQKVNLEYRTLFRQVGSIKAKGLKDWVGYTDEEKKKLAKELIKLKMRQINQEEA